jgi:surfactin synthase thioesterase subunit
VFHGDHFYLDAQRDAVLADVSATLALMQRHKTTLEATG